MKRNLVVLTGAGMSQESGLKTFREMGGLWEEFDVMEVASPEGWNKNMELVLKFYNDRRKQLIEAIPNEGHLILAELESSFNVKIITQNVDDLHERAGSTSVLHLHGELKKARSTKDSSLIYLIDGWELNVGDKCEKGSQLRPHIVWFGEAVPAMTQAVEVVENADIFVVVGTSLNVYPAAGLLSYVPNDTPIFLIDPNPVSVFREVKFINEKASAGLNVLKSQIIKLKRK